MAFAVMMVCPIVWAGGYQDAALVVRPGPPARQDFEVDEDGDGVPDGWYNARDARLEAGTGIDGPTALRFDAERRGRPARMSRAFGVDGRTTEAVVIGLWVQVDAIAGGERIGEDPGLVIDLLDESLTIVGRATMGPWNLRTLPAGRWVRVAIRLNVPPSSRDAILSTGLFGATGTLRIDGMTIDLVPVGGVETENLVLNGDLELGDPRPEHWNVEGSARRAMPGNGSASCLELSRSGDRGQAVLAVPLRRIDALEVRLQARTSGLRGGGGAVGEIYFVDEGGQPLAGSAAGARLFRFSGSTGWQGLTAKVRVPAGAARAVLQFDKTDNVGTLWIDDLEVKASPEAGVGRWRPYHAEIDTDLGWFDYAASAGGRIEAGTALDASGLLDAPAGRHGFVGVRQGRLMFADGSPARFYGVVVLPPLAVVDRASADLLAENLARRGVNLAHLVELDAPYGPGRSLLDDTAVDTVTLDAELLGRFDHLVAALASRGVYVAIDLVSGRRFREGDAVPGGGALPPGGGAATAFDPTAKGVILAWAEALLAHVNPETGRALKDEPALAWLTLSGEQTAFALLDDPDGLPAESRAVLRGIAERRALGSGRRLWQALESEQWTAMAELLRTLGIRVPIAGVSHWRREPEFGAAQGAAGLDVIEDRLFWSAPLYASGARRSMVGQAEGSLTSLAGRKRRKDRPYLVGQWAHRGEGLWAMPFEGADLLLGTAMGTDEGWDAVVRRGVFPYPESWGAAPTGTAGSTDLFALPEVVNANPAVFAMLPHGASLFLRGAVGNGGRGGRAGAVLAWDPGAARFSVDTAFTQALGTLLDRRTAKLSAVTLEVETPGATIAVSSLGVKPIGEAERLLVTAVARVQPTGLTYADACRTWPGRWGAGPMRVEAVQGRVTWRGRAGVKAYALDGAGVRVGEVVMEKSAEGSVLVLDGRSGGLHWELVAEAK